MPILSILSVAFAGHPELSVVVESGTPSSYVDGYAQPRLGAGLAAAWQAAPAFAIEVRGDLWPYRSRPGWDGITSHDVDRIRPSSSQLVGAGTAWARFSPVRGELSGRERKIPFSLDLAAGTGVACTIDDLDRLEATGDPQAEATRKQVLPTAGISAGVRVGDRWGVRVDGTWMSYVETVYGTELEYESPASLRIGVFVSPRPRADRE